MNRLEALFYSILYGYVILGIFQILQIYFRASYSTYNTILASDREIDRIGINETTSRNFNSVYDSIRLYQIEE